MNSRYFVLSVFTVSIGIAAGIATERFYFNAQSTMNDDSSKVLYWVAPMDPNFRKDSPGKSPMGMDLIPVYEGQEANSDPSEVSLSSREINAIGVRTAVSQVSEISQEIKTVGFVGYDEQKTSHIHTRVDGWIETLDIRSVGEAVKKDDRLFQMFSQEFAIASFDFVNMIKNGNKRAQESARSKLRSHGASERQIDEIAASGEMTRTLDIYAPQDGVITKLEAAEGMFLQPGIQAVSLTDLSTVWLIVDVFERDIGRITTDMTAVATFEHMPGETFKGTIDYIYPSLDASTRTLPIRLRFDNSKGLLKPNMFASVSLIPNSTRTAVTVPSEAVIRTGRAERIIIQTADGTFKPRLVTTGLRNSFGDATKTEIVQGLSAGEQVVASAQFLIDSESSLSAGLMRMAPTDKAPARGVGTLVKIDTDRRVVTIDHDELPSLDWPAMRTDFQLKKEISLSKLALGTDVSFRVARGADGILSIFELNSDDGVAATGTGVVQAVTEDGKLSLAHDAIADIGWPPMEMDMTVKGVDLDTVPLNEPIEFDLSKGDDDAYTIVAVRALSKENDSSKEVPISNNVDKKLTPIVVTGIINSVDVAENMANISHGPMKEIGMPGMTMDFKISSELDPKALITDAQLELTFVRPDAATIILAKIGSLPQPMSVSGTINSIDMSDRTANITHGPMKEIGMPGMTMDFPISEDIVVESLPKDKEMMLLFSKGSDFSLMLIGIAEQSEVTQ